MLLRFVLAEAIPIVEETSAVANPHQIGIWYDTSLGVWTIYNEDGSSIPLGAEFNVMVVQPMIFQSSPDAFTQVATSANTSGDSTCINNAFSNGQPDIFVFVTHIYSGYFTDLPAVWYNASSQESCVFDGSFNNMPVGAQFSVLIL